jgi:isoleucyl-tRNA synthetase
VYEEGIDETTRHFLLTLWNTYAFFVTYANLDGWTPTPSRRATSDRHVSDRHVLDRWVRSRLHSTIEQVTTALDGFDALGAASALDALVDDISNWYVRRSRARFWKAADADAHETLHECLLTISLLLAPFCPFVADELYRNLAVPEPSTVRESVHLQNWPTVEAGAVDLELEAQVATARELVRLGRAARNEATLKTRQPLRRALVLLPDGRSLAAELVAEVADELNVKAVEPIGDLDGLLDEHVVANFRRLGPKAGPLMPSVKDALGTLDATALRHAFQEHGRYQLALDGGTTIEIEPDDVEIRASAHAELALARDGGYAVALDTALDDELRSEGLARELVRSLNDLRKARGLELSDRIRVRLGAAGPLLEAARRHGAWIAGEVLATEWALDDAPDGSVGTGDGIVLTVGPFQAEVWIERVS